MPVIKRPVLDANDMQVSYVDYTTTNNTANGWGGRRKRKALSSNFYPYVFSFTTSTTEPTP